MVMGACLLKSEMRPGVYVIWVAVGGDLVEKW